MPQSDRVSEPPKSTASNISATKEIAKALRGPVFERFQQLVPSLGAQPYDEIIGNPYILDGCLKIFRQHRHKFQDLLIDAGGKPVEADNLPLAPCGRSADDVIGMVVRTCAKKYFTAADKGKDEAVPTKDHHSAGLLGLLERVKNMIRRLWLGHEAVHPTPKPRKIGLSRGERLYAAINDYLQYDWQVILIPFYATLPVPLIEQLGSGLLTLREPQKIETLAKIGSLKFNEAQTILGAELGREMLDIQPLAADGVAHAGKREFERLQGALHQSQRMEKERFWQIFTSSEMIDALATKNLRDITEFADHLHCIGADTVNILTDHVQPNKLSVFLHAARTQLGDEAFIKIFGPDGQPELVRTFALKSKEIKHDSNDLEDFQEQLQMIFQAYLRHPEGFGKSLY